MPDGTQTTAPQQTAMQPQPTSVIDTPDSTGQFQLR